MLGCLVFSIIIFFVLRWYGFYLARNRYVPKIMTDEKWAAFDRAKKIFQENNNVANDFYKIIEELEDLLDLTSKKEGPCKIEDLIQQIENLR